MRKRLLVNEGMFSPFGDNTLRVGDHSLIHATEKPAMGQHTSEPMWSRRSLHLQPRLVSISHGAQVDDRRWG